MAVVRLSRLYALGVGLSAVACGGGDGGTAPPGPPTQLVISGGNNQSWYFNNPLPTPYTVTVRDANNRPVPGVSVDWSITTGGGTLSANPSTTNSSGLATTIHTLGTATTYVVTASVTAIPATVPFSASASAPPAAADVTVGPNNTNTFSPGNVVIQTGGTVTWTWASAPIEGHNVTYTGGPTPRPADSPNPSQKTGTFQSTITLVGRYTYTCTNHFGMNGTLTVVN